MVKTYLNVPYKCKGIAKTLGCYWDCEKKAWYTNESDATKPLKVFDFIEELEDEPFPGLMPGICYLETKKVKKDIKLKAKCKHF